MENRFNTRSMIFTLYGDYISHYGNEIWIGSLIRLLVEFGHNEAAVRAAISRMGKQGWVQSRKKGNKSYYRLTAQGVKRVDEAAARIFKLRPGRWDGKWRLLVYTISEGRRHLRDELRREIIWSGFGRLSGGCWISPNPLEEQVRDVIARYHIASHIHFFTSEYNGPAQNRELVSKCWDLDETNERYRQFIRHYSRSYEADQRKMDNKNMTDGECFVERTRLVHEYRKFLFVDPGLPQELLPDRWLGGQAASLFSEYYRLLAVPASRFFEATFCEGNEVKNDYHTYDALTHPFMIENE